MHIVWGIWNIHGDSEDEDVDMTEVHVAAVKEVMHKTGMIIKIVDLAAMTLKEILSITEVRGQDNSFRGQ